MESVDKHGSFHCIAQGHPTFAFFCLPSAVYHLNALHCWPSEPLGWHQKNPNLIFLIGLQHVKCTVLMCKSSFHWMQKYQCTWNTMKRSQLGGKFVHKNGTNCSQLSRFCNPTARRIGNAKRFTSSAQVWAPFWLETKLENDWKPMRDTSGRHMPKYWETTGNQEKNPQPQRKLGDKRKNWKKRAQITNGKTLLYDTSGRQGGNK